MKKSVFMVMLLLLGIAIPTFAQLKVTLNMSSRPDPYLSNWAERKETVIVTVINSGTSSIRAKFDCKINKDGSLIVNTKPEKMKILDIPSGVSQYYGEDLVPFEAAKIKDGADQTAIKTGMLPAGSYEFCCSLLDPQDKQLTAPVCKSFTLQSYQAPVLLQPEDKGSVKNKSRPMFRWTPVSPKPNFSVSYQLRVFEVLAGQTPINAFRANRPILERSDIPVTQFQWPADVELPNPKLQHIWTVRALDDKGNAIGEPTGYATPFTFTDCCYRRDWADPCCPPDDKVVDRGNLSSKDVGSSGTGNGSGSGIGSGKGIGNGIGSGNVTSKEENPNRVKCDCGVDLYGKDADACCRLCQFLQDGTYIPGCSGGSPVSYIYCASVYSGMYSNTCNGVDMCLPCLGCCPYPGRPGEYIDVTTGKVITISNVHPDIYLNNYCYWDGKIIPVELIDLSEGGTVLMQLVDRFDSLQVVPSYLAGEKVIISSKGKEISQTKIRKNGEYIFTLPPGFKNFDEIEVVIPSAKIQPRNKRLCSEILTELVFRDQNGVYESSEGWLSEFATNDLKAMASYNRCSELKAFIPTKSPDVNAEDFPTTTLPKCDKDQIRITETQEFTWTTPELLTKMGYKSLTFKGAEYTIRKSINGGIYTVELPVSKGVKIDEKSILSKGILSQQCHTANYDCKGIGFSCLVMFPDQSQNNCRLTPIIENNEIVRVKLDYRIASINNMYVHSHWREHWNDGLCNPRGIYCFNRLEKITGSVSKVNIDNDESIGETKIELNGDNTINIVTIGQKSNISKETIELFANHKIEITPNGLPDDVVKKLFSSANLKTPKESIVFKPSDQSYKVVNTIFEGKPSKIIEARAQTNITIDGKEYTLTVINTSGEGVDSSINPKNPSIPTEKIIWGKTGHWCHSTGLYCYIKKWDKGPGGCLSKVLLPNDESCNELSIEMKNGDEIIIRSIGQTANITEVSINNFQNNKIEKLIEDYPNDYFNELFKSIKLGIPQKNISFKPEDIRYDVFKTTFDGKPTQIIEIYQRTKIIVDGKEFKLTLITTSGKGVGSPKSAGF